MQTFFRNDIRLGVLKDSSKQRYLIAEFIDEYNLLSMGFISFCNGVYVLQNIPRLFEPTILLLESMWITLDTNDHPPLAVPGGYYFGDGFHTIRALEEDIYILEGEEIEEVEAPDGLCYKLVLSEVGGQRVLFFGHYAGMSNTGSPYQSHMWRPTPVPQTLLNNKSEMFTLYGLADMEGATFMTFTNLIN